MDGYGKILSILGDVVRANISGATVYEKLDASRGKGERGGTYGMDCRCLCSVPEPGQPLAELVLLLSGYLSGLSDGVGGSGWELHVEL